MTMDPLSYVCLEMLSLSCHTTSSSGLDVLISSLHVTGIDTGAGPDNTVTYRHRRLPLYVNGVGSSVTHSDSDVGQGKIAIC